jgi:hypothetical protein
MPSLQATEEHGLSGLLEEITQLDKDIAALSARVDDMKKRRVRLEQIAVEDMTVQRLDGVRVAGRSWRVEESLHLSVPKDRRDAVLEAARAVGIEDAITTVATTTLKAWLVERAKETGREAGSPFAAGTPFDGIVGEYTEMKLRHVTVG